MVTASTRSFRKQNPFGVDRKLAEELLQAMSDDDLAALVGVAEYARTNDQFMPWLEHRFPDQHRQLETLFRVLAVRAVDLDWRGGGARPEQLLPGTEGSFSDRTDWRYWSLTGGRGCVAAGTMIQGPDGPTAVEDWAGGLVWAVDSDGALTPALAGPAFKKGRDHLFRVATARGDVVTVTAQHRFLTPLGWRRLADLSIGDVLACLPDQFGPSMSLEDGQRSTHKVASSRADYRRSRNSRGQRPPGGSRSDQSQPQRLGGALAHSPDGSRVGGEASWPSRSHHGLGVALLARTHCVPAEPWPEGARSHIVSSSVAPTRPHGQTQRLSPWLTSPEPASPLAAPLVDLEPFFQESRSASSPLGGWSHHGALWPELSSAQSSHVAVQAHAAEGQWRTLQQPTGECLRSSSSSEHTVSEIVSIGEVGEGVFYDLTVPGFQNYVANGIVHHNSGKSLAGAHACRELLYGTKWAENPRGAFVGRTLDAARLEMFINTFMTIIPPGSILAWRKQVCELELLLPNRRIGVINGFTSEKPDQLRGPNLHFAWGDEIASWQDSDRGTAAVGTAWSNLNMAVRTQTIDLDGNQWRPRIITTTTPKAVRILHNLDPDDSHNPGPGLHQDPKTVVSSMSTLDNLDNLAPSFYDFAIAPFEGTRLYAQEVLGELMLEAVGAKWSSELIDQMSRNPSYVEIQAGGLRDVVVGIDPAASMDDGEGAEHGIVVAGKANDGNCYVLQDASIKGTANDACHRVNDVATKWGARKVVVEINHGGTWVAETLGRAYPELNIEHVWAKHKKRVRADPVALLSDRGRLFLAGSFPKLTHQMRTYTGEGPSPDRLDAMVYAVMFLMPSAANASKMVSVINSRFTLR